MTLFASEADLDELLLSFESCTLSHEAWTHREHLAVAACYVFSHDEMALEVIRAGILRLNASHGVENTDTGGYHESITVAWVALFGLLKLECDSRLALANRSLEMFADKRYLLRFYSRDRIMSVEARKGWVEPDLMPFSLR